MKYKYDNYWKPGLQETHWGYPEEFGEKPLGYHVYASGRTMVANGEAARMVLFEYDFEENSERLSPRGMLQLSRISYMLPRNFFPLVIQASPHGNANLDAARRQAVLDALAQGNFPVPEERVVVNRPPTYGIDGVDANIFYTDLLNTATNRAAFRTGLEGDIQGPAGGGGAGGATSGGTAVGQ